MCTYVDFIIIIVINLLNCKTYHMIIIIIVYLQIEKNTRSRKSETDRKRDGEADRHR